MVVEQVYVWYSQYPSGQCTSAAVGCCWVKGGEGGKGQQRLPMCCCGIQNREVITRNREVETPKGTPGAELSPADNNVQLLCHVYTVHRPCGHFPLRAGATRGLGHSTAGVVRVPVTSVPQVTSNPSASPPRSPLSIPPPDDPKPPPDNLGTPTATGMRKRRGSGKRGSLPLGAPRQTAQLQELAQQHQHQQEELKAELRKCTERIGQLQVRPGPGLCFGGGSPRDVLERLTTRGRPPATQGPPGQKE